MTILFLEDWQKYPDAIVDTKTKNTSFIRFSALLKSMGIKNHALILALHNPELQGIDPFDPNLTLEQMAMVAIECKTNFWYYIREIARDPKGTIEDPILFKINRGNFALFWLFFNHIMVILIQIRQTGKSFSTDTLMTYLLNIRCNGTEINLLTKDDTLRAANLERLKNIELVLPYYLKQRGKGDVGNTEELSIKALGNRYRGHLPNKSPKMALNVGRGLTSPIFQIDEAAFFFNIAISMPAALAAGTAAREIASRKGDPYGTIITTTAGKKDDRDGRYIYDLVQESAIWTEKFLDARNIEELENLIRLASPKKKLQVNCTFNHRQLGYTDEWLKRAIEESKAIGEDADRDFGNVWTSGSQISPLTPEQAETIRNSERSDFYPEICAPYGYIIRWYIPVEAIIHRIAQTHVTLAVDSSDAAGGDDIAMNFRDIKTGETLGAANINETNLIHYSEWLCSLLVKFTNLTLIIERRSTGAMIIDYLLMMLPAKGIDPFARIYNKAVQEADEFPERYKEIQKPLFSRSADIYVQYKKLFGFATSGTGLTSRSELYSTTLLNSVKLCADKVYDKKTIDQLLSLIIKNGRVDHPDGGHDDSVIAWLLGYWLITQGKNLHFYGINSRDILSLNKTNEQLNNPQIRYEVAMQQILRKDIEALVEQIRIERDDFVAIRLENKLRLLVSRLTETDRQTLSVDDLINNLRESRRLNQRRNYNFNYSR